MPKTKISEFSATPGNNTDIDGINIAEGCAPSGINDAIRELMAQLKDFQAGTAGDSFNGPVGTSTAAAGAFTTLSATGVATFSSGTAGAPAITTTGDTNTGIFFPAADTVAASVGGTEGLRLTSTGLGVGTTSPAYKLQVNGGRAVFTGSNENYTVGIGRESNTNAYYLGVHSTTNPNLLFSNNAGTTNLTLTYDGNLGLGVTPSAWADYKALQMPGAAFLGYSDGSGNNQAIVAANCYWNGANWIYRTTDQAARYSLYDGQAIWYNAPSGTAGNAISFTQAMTLDASGNLGVGVTAPATRLEVLGANEGEYFRAGGGTISARSLQFSSFTVSGLTGVGHQINVPNASGVLTFATGSTERARITSGGKLLLNTTSTVVSGDEIFGAIGTSGIGVKCTGGSSYFAAGLWNNATSGDNVFVYFYTETAGDQRGSITYNRGGGVVAYNTTSDYRAKDILGPVQNAGATIDGLKVYMGKMKGATIERPMMIAHEAQEVTPYAVTGEKDAVNDKGEPIYQAMDHQVLVPLLIAEIQSLRARVAALESNP